MAVRVGLYKAHLWTWTNSIEEFHNVSFNILQIKAPRYEKISLKLNHFILMAASIHRTERRGVWVLDTLVTCCLPQYLGHPQQ